MNNDYIPNNVPNLDCLDSSELMAFYGEAHLHNRVKARELFASRPKGYCRVTKDLGHYAANLATAQRCRLSGDINTAQVYETICDRIYSELPTYAQW